MSLSVNVIIVSYKSVADIRNCLEALGKSTYANFKVQICENGGTAAYDEICAALPKKLPGGQPVQIFLSSGNLGYGGGINHCLDVGGEADAYWILNPDTIPAPDALAGMVARLEQGDCDAVGHDLTLPDGNLAARAGGVWHIWAARPISLEHGKPRSGPATRSMSGSMPPVRRGTFVRMWPAPDHG